MDHLTEAQSAIPVELRLHPGATGRGSSGMMLLICCDGSAERGLRA